MITYRVPFTIDGRKLCTAMLNYWASGYSLAPDKVPTRTELETFLRKVSEDYGMEAFYQTESFADESHDEPYEWNKRLSWALVTLRMHFPEMDDHEVREFEKTWRVGN